MIVQGSREKRGRKYSGGDSHQRRKGGVAQIGTDKKCTENRFRSKHKWTAKVWGDLEEARNLK